MIVCYFFNNINKKVGIFMKEKFSIVIPVYNGENSLEQLYKKTYTELVKLQKDYEFIFIDDNSVDNSFKIIEKICQLDENVVGIRLNKNYGQQNAVFCGLEYSRGDYIINMDDDLQHNPIYIEEMYNKLSEGYDIVYGVTKVKYHKRYRNFGSKLTNQLFNFLLKKPTNKRVSSYRIMKKELKDLIVREKKAYNYISASILKKSKNIGNIHYQHSTRKYGDSNYTFIKQLKIFMRIFLYYSNISVFKPFLSKSEPYSIKNMIDNRKES